MRNRWLLLALALVLLVVETAGAVALIIQGDHNDGKWATIAFAVPPGVAFALAGIVALWRRPANRTGFFLGAVGYVWFVGALAETNSNWLFTASILLSSFAFIPFVLLVFAHPTGRLESRWQHRYVVVASAALLVVPVIQLLVDRTPEPEGECVNGCRESTIAVFDSPRAADVMVIVSSVVGIVLILAAGALLVARWRGATPAHRNALRPVLATSSVAIGALLVLNTVDIFSPGASTGIVPIFLVTFAAVPVAFLIGILRTKLARASVAQLVVELGHGAPLQTALAKALGDPTLEVAYRTDDRGWIDATGRPVADPARSEGRSLTLVEGEHGHVATLIHDPSLDEEHELVSAVTAAASLSLENERLDAALRAQLELTETIVDTVPSLLVHVDVDGAILKANRAAVRAVGLERSAELVGRPFWDVFIAAEERDAMVMRFRAAAPGFARASYENTFTNDRGDRTVIAWESAPVADSQGRVVGIVAGGLDVTERKERELELARERDLRRHQAAEVRASRARIVRAADDARKRLERNLHDGAQQRLVSLSITLRLIESKLETHPESVAALVKSARQELTDALDELRELARGIHPAILSDRGLMPAVEALASRLPIDVSVTAPEVSLPDAIEAALYYVVAESLTNVVRYADTSDAAVSIDVTESAVVVVVADEGIGGADPTRGSGLRGLQDRVSALDGRMWVESQPGGGTRVIAEIPLATVTA